MNNVDVEAVRRKAIRQGRLLAVFFLLAVIAPIFIYCPVSWGEEVKPIDKPVAQVEQKAQDAAKTTSEKKDLPITEKIKIIRNIVDSDPELFCTRLSVELVINVKSESSHGLLIHIRWRDGKKLLGFKGKEYVLDITDKEGNGSVDEVFFSFYDIKARNDKFGIERPYKIPIPSIIKKRVNNWYAQIIDYIYQGDKEPGYQLLDEFNLPQFYEECVKASVLER
jgi:hypothetical protein